MTDGNVTRFNFAAWDPNGTNIISVYAKCPAGFNVPEFNCSGTATTVDWGSEMGQTALAHEIGHTLGLDHDRAQSAGGTACPMTLMNALPTANAPITDADCGVIDRMNSSEAPCNQTKPDATETNPCEMARAGGGSSIPRTTGSFCESYPWLCTGGPGGWSGGASDCHYFCVSSLGTQWCSWSCTAPAAFSAGDATAGDGTVEVAGPLLALASPAENAQVSGILLLSGWAHHFAHVTEVSFGVDGQQVAVADLKTGLYSPEACSPPDGLYWTDACNRLSGFTANLETRALTNGLHTLQVTARGTSGFPSVLEREFLVSNSCFDSTPPTVALSTPPASVLGVVALAATASDDVALTRVELFVDGVSVGSRTAAPFTFQWDTGPYSAGAHAVQLKAYDGCNNSAVSTRAVFTVVKDTAAPQVSLVSPAASAVIRGSTFLVQVQASDNFGVSRVELYVDGALKGTDSTAPYSFTWSVGGDGQHSFLAKAIDGAGNVGTSATVSARVDNIPPQLDVSSPAFNQTVSGASVKVAGWATDGSGSIALGFTVDGFPLSTTGTVVWISRQDVCDTVPVGDPRCPNVGWRGFFDSTRLANGWHTLQVTATDAAGWVATSARINFYVANALAPMVSRFFPTDDARARQAFPNSNYGKTNDLGVRSWSTNDGSYSFLKFNVAGVGGTIMGVRLLLKTTPSPLTELYVYRVDSTWSESAITWANMPSASAVELAHRLSLAASTWYDFDAASYVTGNGTYSFGLASADTAQNLGCWSREAPDSPILEVTYVP